jgi:Concanavalin A-like lectin/glucanases superfamily/Bacterial Ig domain
MKTLFVMETLLLVFLIGCKTDNTYNIAPQDNVSPTVNINSPSDGVFVSDTVTISMSVSDNVGVSRVEVYIDGNLANTSTNSPWLYKWPTQSLPVLSSHPIFAKAYDPSNNVGTSQTIVVSIKMGNFAYHVDAYTVGLWHFDETGGTTATDAAGINDGLITGTTAVVGHFGSCRNFSGNGDNIRIADLQAYKVSNFTIEAWVMNTNANPVPQPSIVGMVDGSSSDGGGTLAINSNLTFTFGIRGTSGPMVVNSSTIATVGQWKHVAAVRTSDGVSTQLKLYVNGVLEAQQTFTNDLALFTNTNWIYFGDQGANLGNGAQHWSGTIDEVRFSNKERTPREFNLP